jgi:hypothetical protein
MGATFCTGAVAKAPEVCNNVDDDCNGRVDDNIPGAGAPCVDPTLNSKGECHTVYKCLLPPGAGPNGLTCTQAQGPMPELCNGKDDDCDGVVDDNLRDPAVGVRGGPPCQPLPAGQMQPPCDPGTTVCQNGAVVCSGRVGPQPNMCDGISRDCTGQPNVNGGSCPTGFQCLMGNCLAPCAPSEFPCPGGFVCDPVHNLCVSDACARVSCEPGDVCIVDNSGKGVCTDPCDRGGITCPAGFVCRHGACVDNTCRSQGCPSGQVCVGAPPACQPDPCAGIACPAGMYCADGNCVGACPETCMRGDQCVDGMCQPDPCAGVDCPGQACAVVDGVGMCVADQCTLGCDPGAVCCGGSCVADPCAAIACPAGARCVVNSLCGGACQERHRPPADEIVSAGGGGAACAMGGRRAPVPSLLLLLPFALLGRARRRR